jgi:hypothetical protein
MTVTITCVTDNCWTFVFTTGGGEDYFDLLKHVYVHKPMLITVSVSEVGYGLFHLLQYLSGSTSSIYLSISYLWPYSWTLAAFSVY